MSILLTGGTGFIGSHTAVELIENGYDVIIADDLSNSDSNVLDKIKIITGVKPLFCFADVSNKKEVRNIFLKNEIDAVIHFAGFKAVGESVQKPLAYYRNNIDTTLTILETMVEFDVKNIVFSSSATVYSLLEDAPFGEDDKPLGCTNPYGWTKYMNEQILKDVCKAHDMSVVTLRYFNPIGAHGSGLIGERPMGTPNNLMPYIAKVAKGEFPKLYVFGNDYPTRDGTGERDYIHITDLAKGHVKALDYCLKKNGYEVFNLGTGKGCTVLELIETFEKVNGIRIPYEITDRRAGDVAICYADAKKAESILGWKAEKTIEDMCRDV